MAVRAVRFVGNILLVVQFVAPIHFVGWAQETPQNSPSGEIRGVIKSGNQALPGVSVSATNTLTGQKAVTSTDPGGGYVLHVPAKGRYVVRAELPAFAASTREVLINASTPQGRVDFELVLFSRAGEAAARERQREGPAAQGAGENSPRAEMIAGENSLGAGDTGNPAAAGAGAVPALQIPGFGSDTATESVSIIGNTARTDSGLLSTDAMRERFRDRQQAEQGFPPGGVSGRPPGSGGGAAGSAGFGGGFGGGGPFLGGGGGRGRFDINRPHGTIYYTLGNSAFDATPFSLTGAPVSKPSYAQHSFGGALGGPLNIPKIYHGGAKTFFFVNYNGSRSGTPYDAFSTVPTREERQGIFSHAVVRNGPNAGTPVEIFNPVTHQPFPNNTIPQVDKAAANLLNFIPLPNLPGDSQNFHFLTPAQNSSDAFNLRLIHAFGGSTIGPRRGGGPRNNLNLGFRFRRTRDDLTNPFPSVGGRTSIQGIDAPVGYVRSFGKFTNLLRFEYNCNRISTQNLYAFSQNIAAQAGINGVSPNPFDFGLPTLSFTNFGGLSDISPLLQRDQTFTFSDSIIWTRGRHTLRWGGDFRRLQHNTQTDSNARGSFVFTGFNTAEMLNGVPVPGTGFDFADFLLGRPQSTSVQFGVNNYQFRANSWDLFVQDEWRVRGNLTLNLGLRYEYVSPYAEIHNQIVNLDVAPGFTAVAPVLPGQTGPFSGRFPITLVNPDRNNFAPRVGIAWKPLRHTVVRAGYGINYATATYGAIAQQLSFQPPFSTTQTNIEQPGAPPRTLANGFPPPQGTVTNNYGVNRDYRLGYAQIWNLDIQQQLGSTVLLNLDYTGTKGTRLDIVEAPNRSPSGLRIPGAQPFLWETSDGDSILHAGTIRLRKRLQGGMAVGGSYTFSKSIDNASSIGGGATVVAQNAFDLAAERGLSSFDQRHRFTADYLWELPFGHTRRWLTGKSFARSIFGDWEWSGDWTIASGYPLTVRVLGNFADVRRGTNGTLRADTTGQPLSIPNPSVAEWFNTAAFVVPPAGQFGDAGRNIVAGPGAVVFDMALTKVIPFGDVRVLELRAQATNIFNRPQFTAVDTIVNSPTFGRVISAGPMRTIQLVTRFRF